MNFELYERRLKMLRYSLQGVKTQTWIREVAQEYGVQERSIWVDWNKRHEWIPIIYSIQDNAESITTAVSELVADTRQAREELYRLYRDVKSDSGRVNTLKEVNNNIKLELELRQDMGLIPVAAKDREDRVGEDEHILRELLREHRESIQAEASALEHLHKDDLPKSLDTQNKR